MSLNFALSRPAALAFSLVFMLISAVFTQPVRASDFTLDQKEAIRGLIKEYLISHPEIIQDAMNELEKRQAENEKVAQAKALSEFMPVLSQSSRSTVLGNPKGDITLVEFFDYNCGYCKSALNDLVKLVKDDPQLRVVIRDFPVLGPDSVEAAIVAVAARQQFSGAKYLEFHQKLLESKGRIGKDRAIAVAKDLGADVSKLNKDMEVAETKSLISETMTIADALRLQGTPAYVVGDEVVFGAVGHAALKSAIDNTRRCGKAKCS
jgi:protein-disulfide isomerase